MTMTTLTNVHPADELSDLRLAIAQMQKRADYLRDQLLMLDAGSTSRVSNASVFEERISPRSRLLSSFSSANTISGRAEQRRPSRTILSCKVGLG
jgi:hypothetical protein